MDQHDIGKILSEQVKHLDQYFGVWSMQIEHFESLSATVRNTDLIAHISQAKGAAGPMQSDGYRVTPGGVAVIDLVGVMTKYGSSFSDMPHGTIGVRAQLKEAMRNDAVKAVVLRVDSPGGTSSSANDLASDIAKANESKPVVAYIEDLGASAAYHVASQASAIYANEGALVGSIGTYAVVRDLSAYYEKEGIKTHVIRAGEFKGMGEPGSRVSDAQLENLQGMVERVNALFLERVSAGRKMSAEQIKGVATGAVWISKEAQAMGLIDGTKSFDDVIAELEASAQAPKNKKSGAGRSAAQQEIKTMSEENKVETPKSASIAEIKAACPGADAAWVLGQVEKGATIQEVQAEFIKVQAAQGEVLRAEAEAAKAALNKPGNTPVGSGAPKGNYEGSATSEWNRLVNEAVAKGHKRDKALSLVNHQNPGLREAMVEESNAGK